MPSSPPKGDLSTVDVQHPQQRSQSKRRGAHNWHLRRADKGPGRLAMKNHFIAMIGEYVGTVLFMIFALGGTNVANIPTTSVTGGTQGGQDGSTASTANTSNLLYISLSFGFSLAVNAWIFFRVSGGLFNPAVSLGMVLVGALKPLRGALLTLSQILGGITGAAIIDAITPGTLNVRTQLGGGTSVAQGLFIEMFLTSLLMLAILLLAAEKHKATFIAPIGIGLALFVAELLGVYYTGGSLNPARSFGPCVVLHSFESYDWIYWVGPILGVLIAAGFYKMLKWLQYETVLGPDTDGDAPPPKTSTTSPGLLAGSRPANDEESQIEGGAKPKRGNYAVSGPGLGDLLTEGSTSAVYDLDRAPEPMAARLDRIERLLQQMVPGGAGASGANIGAERLSSATYVDESAGGLRAGDHLDAKAATEGSTFARTSRFSEDGPAAASPTATAAGGQGTSPGRPTTRELHPQRARAPSLEPHTEPHVAFVSGVAGDAGRPHVDYAVNK